VALSRRAKRRLIVLISVIVVLAGAVVAVKVFRTQQRQRMIADAYDRGVAAYEQDDLDVALKELSYYLQNNKETPEAAEVMLMFADARQRVPLENGRHLGEAMSWSRQALGLLNANPDLEDYDDLRERTLESLLDLHRRLGMRPELIGVADDMLKLHPDHEEALSAKAWAHYANREFEEAQTAVERLIALKKDDARPKHLMLQIMRGLNRPDADVLAQCDAWIDEYEGDARFILLKAGWLAELGRLEEAIDTAEEAAVRGVSTLEVLKQMVSLLDLLGLQETAADVLEEARSQFPEAQWVPQAMCRRLWEAGHLDQAIEELRRTEETFDVLDADMLRLKAVVLFSAERRDELPGVIELLKGGDEGDDIHKDLLWAEAFEARLTMGEQPYRETIEALELAIAVNPRDAVLEFFLGETFTRIGDRSRAIEAYRNASRMQPNWLAASAALTEALLDAGRPHEAYRISRMLVGRAAISGKLPLYIQLVRAYLASLSAGGDPALMNGSNGELVDVITLLRSMHDQFPQRGDVALLTVEAYCLTDRSTEAQAFIARLIDDDVLEREAWFELAQASRRFQLDAEEDLMRIARQRAGDTLGFVFARAETLAAEDRAADGLAAIDEAIGMLSSDHELRPVARRQRLRYMLRHDLDHALADLSDYAVDFADDPLAQNFVLSLTEAWGNETLIRSTINRLAASLGEDDTQVRLAQANALLTFNGDDEAQRATAIVKIADALEESPESLAGLLLMVQASLSGEHPSTERAIEHLERAVRVAPARTDLYVQLITLLQREGDFDTADQYLEQLSRLAERDRDAAARQFRLLYAQGDVESALAVASQVVTDDASINDRLVLAMLHLKAGRYDEAGAAYEALLADAPRNQIVVAQAAEYYASTGEFQHGVEILEAFEPEGGESVRSILIGILHQRHGQLEQARKWLVRATEQDPDSADARLQLARLYLATGEPGPAKEQAMAGLRIEPERAALRAALASANMNLNATGRADAIALLRELGQEDDSLLAVLELVDRVPTDGDRTTPTDENLADAVKLTERHPQFLPAWMLAISLHREAGQMRTAIELSRRAVGRFPTEPRPAEWSTRLLAEADRWEESIVEAREWRVRMRHNPIDVDLFIAEILMRLDRPRDAASQLEPYAERFVSELDTAPERLVNWLQVVTAAGQVERAWSTVEPLMADDEEWRFVWFRLVQMGDCATAGRMLQRIDDASEGGSFDHDLLLANQWATHGQRCLVETSLDRAEQLAGAEPADDPTRFAWLMIQAQIAEGRGRFDGAEAAYRRMLEMQPGNPGLMNNIAYVMSRRGERGDEALRLVDAALEQAPDQSQFLDTRTRVLISLNRLEEARATVDEAIALAPDDLSLMLTYAEVLLEQNVLDDAESVLADVRIRLEDPGADQPELEGRLQRLSDQLRERRAAQA
jgi:tetratricopeptide (TPR) repeat protein